LRFRRLVPSVLPGLMVALIMLGVAGPVRPAAADEPTGFRAEVDLSPLARIAVQSEGRLKSFDSFANGMMHFVSGPRRIAGQSPSYTYLDMMCRPEAYTDADVIYVKNKSVRLQLAEALTRSRPELADRMQIFVR